MNKIIVTWVFGTGRLKEDHFNIMNTCNYSAYTIGKYAEFDACFGVHDWLSRIYFQPFSMCLKYNWQKVGIEYKVQGRMKCEGKRIFLLEFVYNWLKIKGCVSCICVPGLCSNFIVITISLFLYYGRQIFVFRVSRVVRVSKVHFCLAT